MIQFTQEQIAQLDKYFRPPRNLVDLFETNAAKWGDRPAIGQKDPATKKYIWTSYRGLAERINNLRGALHKLGLQKGETVGVILGNSVEWFVIENAVHGLGGRFIPMYEKELVLFSTAFSGERTPFVRFPQHSPFLPVFRTLSADSLR